MSTSMYWPWPVCSRCRRAATTLMAVMYPMPESPTFTPGWQGSPSGKPVMAGTPPTDWPMGAKAG